MVKTWNLNNKKWLYWTGEIGFLIPLILMMVVGNGAFSIYPLFLIITPILYFIFDRKKPKTKNYQIEKVYLKWILVIGNFYFIVSVLILIFRFLIGTR
jgi:hypothetical protein